MDRPDVTVVLPTHNRAALVVDAVRSALCQQDVAVEVIVVDDGSTDATPLALALEADPRLRVIRNKVSHGVAAARNQALREGSGEWFAFLDDDDLWAPQWLRAALDAAEGQGPAIVYGARLILDETRCVRSGLFAEEPATIRTTLRQRNSIGGPSGVVVHRDVIAAAGPFDERLSALADWEAWLRYVEHGQPVAVPEFLLGYTVYGQNMHRCDPFGVLEEFHRFCAIVAERHGADSAPPEAPFVRWLGRDAAETGNRWGGVRMHLRAARLDGPRDLVRAARCLFGQVPPPPPPLAAPAWLARPGTVETALQLAQAA